MVRGGRNVVSHPLVGEHRRLDELLEALGQAFATESPAERVWEVFEQLCGELHRHFEREDQLYFPAIWALRPELKGPMEEFGGRHNWFRDQLRRIGDHLGHRDPEGAAGVLRSFDESFRIHEKLEEQILTGLDTELED